MSIVQHQHDCILRLQSELSKKDQLCKMLEMEWDAYSLNAVLTHKYEYVMQQNRCVRRLMQQRDVEMAHRRQAL
jgi:type II secretory pathway component PulC